MEREKCNVMKTVRQITYLTKRASAGGGCEAALIARTRCG